MARYGALVAREASAIRLTRRLGHWWWECLRCGARGVPHYTRFLQHSSRITWDEAREAGLRHRAFWCQEKESTWNS